MKATIISEMKNHYPVLLSELISIITPQYGGTFIDCTFGQGGYTEKILDFPKTKVIGLDRDSESFKKAEKIQKKFEDRFFFKNIKFSQLNNLKLKNENIKGVIFDLGYSYTQIKDPQKGLSFDFVGELNMKMGINEFSAKDVINKLDENELEKIFKYFGEEKESKRIAHNIVEDRRSREITTEELVRIIDSSKRKKNYKIHNATKIFQALRIFVNKEISELIYGLINATKVVKKDGVIAVVTFHSIEDKIVKYFFKSLSENKSVSRYMPETDTKINLFNLVNKKPTMPSEKEISENPPSRSAKLRYAIKKENFYNFETDILDKFKTLIEIENFSKKL
jgi:16S rRNA (cytosine1402-N4)-methyltransferase